MAKALAEDCLILSIFDLMKDRSVIAGVVSSGTFKWVMGANVLAEIGYEADLRTINHANLRLRYNRDGMDHDYYVWLSTTSVHFGGHRWWMHCPATGRRVGKLFLPENEGRFASRQAYSLTYKSCRDHRRPDARLKRLAKWKQRLATADATE